jgi:hypothetical protein
MSSPDNVARLREIKRLLDRIQQLPHIAGMPANGLPNGFHAGPPPPVSEPKLPEPPSGGVGPSLDPIMPPIELPESREWTGRESRALVPVQPSVSLGISPWVFVVATAANTIIAAVLAVVITLGVARRDPPPAEAEKLAVAPKPPVPPHSEPTLPRPVELLPVGAPGEPLRLEALKPQLLPLQVRPEEAIEDSYILLLSGLPANATISGASRMGTDSWLVSPGALRRIEIVVPEWSTSVIEVGMELRRSNGAVLAQNKMWLSVPPPQVPEGTKLDQTALKDLVRKGDRLLSRGDIAAARAFYERAAAMGSAEAAFALGSTYDPRRLWSLGVFGMVGNKDRARHWYQRAAELGHPEAKARISALQER